MGRNRRDGDDEIGTARWELAMRIADSQKGRRLLINTKVDGGCSKVGFHCFAVRRTDGEQSEALRSKPCSGGDTGDVDERSRLSV